MKKNCPVQAKFWEMQPRQLATTSEDGGFLPTSVPRQVHLVTKEPKQHFHWCKFLRLFLFFLSKQNKNMTGFFMEKKFDWRNKVHTYKCRLRKYLLLWLHGQKNQGKIGGFCCFLFCSHRYYTETPNEYNILTSFLRRIWVKLSESFSELKIGWFLWQLDQKIVLTLIVNFYRARIGAQLHTDITSVFNVTIDAFNWLSQQLFILPVMLQVFSLDHFQVVLPKLIIWVKISWDHPKEILTILEI